MKQRVAMVVLIACLAVGVLSQTGCARGNPAPTSVAAAGSGSATTTDPASNAMHTDAFGIVTARVSRTVLLEFPAVLEEKVVSEGQRVKRGDVLFRISRLSYDAEVRGKELQLLLARIELREADLGVVKLREDQAVAQEEVDRAQKELADKEELVSLGAMPRSDLEQYRLALRVSQQKLRELTRSLDEYSSGEVNRVDAQRAKIAIAEAELERLLAQSSRPYIRGNTIVCDSPEAVVTEIGYAQGDLIGQQRKLCTLIDPDSFIVVANIPEEFIKDVTIGNKAVVVPVADNARSYEGTVSRISALASKANGETVVPVEVTLGEWDDFLLPNFNVDVSITAGNAPDRPDSPEM